MTTGTVSGMAPDARVYIAGHRGLVGSALVRRLEQAGHTCLLTATRDELDLRDHAAISEWFRAHPGAGLAAPDRARRGATRTYQWFLDHQVRARGMHTGAA